jgi:spore coat protein U-like protein
MKKLIAISAVAAIVAMAGSAMAATTANLAVTASVTNSCSVTGGTLNFNALDTSTAPAVAATSAGVTVTCTKSDATYSVAIDKGLNFTGTQPYLKNSVNTDKIPYTLAVPAMTAATGLAQSIAITGSIAAGSYSLASAGSYADTVTITVTP